MGGHGGVFGWIEATAELEGHVGESLKEWEALVGFDGEVEGEGDAGFWEAHHARGWNVTEGFEDGEEAGEAGFGDFAEDGDGSLFGVLPGDDVLKLKEAAFAVHAVPAENLVERVEEGLVVLEGDGSFVDLLVEERGVEEADGEGVEGEAGSFKGKDQLRFGRGLEIVFFGRVIALHEDAAGEVAAFGGDVDPTDGVLDVLCLIGEVEKLVYAVELNALVVDLAGDDGLEAEGGPGDDAGEAEAADGCGVELGVFRGGADHPGAVGADELELGDVATKGSGGVVVFAVDVVGYCSAEGYIFCAGRDGKEEASGNGEVEDLREGDAGFGSEEAGLGVEVDEAIHCGGDEEVAVLEEADVAVASAHADGECAVVEVGGECGKVALPVEREEFCAVGWVAAPGFEGSLHWGGRFLCCGWIWHRDRILVHGDGVIKKGEAQPVPCLF